MGKKLQKIEIPAEVQNYYTQLFKSKESMLTDVKLSDLLTGQNLN